MLVININNITLIINNIFLIVPGIDEYSGTTGFNVSCIKIIAPPFKIKL